MCYYKYVDGACRQVVKTSDCGSDMHGFESHLAPHIQCSCNKAFPCGMLYLYKRGYVIKPKKRVLNLQTKVPTVSVIMPIFKHSKEQLFDAINSILTQTFTDFELIILDGSADDANFHLISDIKDERIRYFKVKGYVNCLNFGIKKALGKYIARMDSDDISCPRRLEEEVRFLDNNPDIALCSCLAEVFDDYGYIRTSKYQEDIDPPKLTIKQEIIHPAMMYRKELQLKYDNVKPLEDCLLLRKMLLAGKKFGIINKVLFKNYSTEKSLMAKYPKYMHYLKSKINIWTLLQYYNYKLSYGKDVLYKKEFSKSEIIEFLKFVKSAKKDFAKDKLNIYKICTPYFRYMLSKHEGNLFLLITPLYFQTFFVARIKTLAKKLLQFIFSVRNKFKNGRKTKFLQILGIKIIIKKY